MPWDPPKTLQTARLDLRPIGLGDAEFVFGYASDPTVIRFLSFPRHQTVEDSLTWLRKQEEAWETGEGHRAWRIALREGGEPVGTVGVSVEGHKVMAGYVAPRAHWGKGIITEALVAVRDAAWADPSVKRFWLYCDVENHGSARVAEKAGLAFEAVLRAWNTAPNLGPEPRDCKFYAITRA